MMKFVLLLTFIAVLNVSQSEVSENLETPGKIMLNKLFVWVIKFQLFFYTAICFLPELAGNRGRACKAYFPMFRYDSTSKLCVKFIYGGCYGTENRFVTLRECVEVCRAGNTFIPTSKFFVNLWNFNNNKFLLQNKVRCSGFPTWNECNSTTASYFFDPLSEICRDREAGFCTESTNKFNSMDECSKECVSPWDQKQKYRITFKTFITSPANYFENNCKNLEILLTHWTHVAKQNE